MKKLFATLAIFTLIFFLLGCDVDTDSSKGSKGTISAYAGIASSLEIANNSKGFTFSDTYNDHAQ